MVQSTAKLLFIQSSIEREITTNFPLFISLPLTLLVCTIETKYLNSIVCTGG